MELPIEKKMCNDYDIKETVLLTERKPQMPITLLHLLPRPCLKPFYTPENLLPTQLVKITI